MTAVATVINGNTYTIDPRYDLTDSKILGKGSFGVVCSAFDTIRGITLAIKRIRPYANDEWDAKHTLREVRLMRLLGQHPNVITLYELSLYQPKTELYMMIEMMDSDLHKVIQSNKPLTMRHNKCFLKQMLEGIKAMHSIGCLHRDLKPGNILVSKDCQLRITDFGLARFLDDQTKRGENEVSPMTQYVVTRWYRPPELLLAPKLPYGEAVDLWSIGCILAELIKRKALFPGKDHLGQVDLIFQACGYKSEDELGFPIDADSARVLQSMKKYDKQPFSKYIPNADAESLEMLEALLTVNPNHRPSAEQALRHPFLADAEVLHDYSKTYLTRPSPDYFAFESKPFTVPELRQMIHDEVESMSAEAYHKHSPTTHTSPTSPDSVGPVTAASATGSNVSSTAQKPVRRHSEIEESSYHKSAENSVNQAQAQALKDLEADGPASQLPTAKLFANKHNGDSIYLTKNHSDSNVVVHTHTEKKKSDNPFASKAQNTQVAPIVATVPPTLPAAVTAHPSTHPAAHAAAQTNLPVVPETTANSQQNSVTVSRPHMEHDNSLSVPPAALKLDTNHEHSKGPTGNNQKSEATGCTCTVS